MQRSRGRNTCKSFCRVKPRHRNVPSQILSLTLFSLFFRGRAPAAGVPCACQVRVPVSAWPCAGWGEGRALGETARARPARSRRRPFRRCLFLPPSHTHTGLNSATAHRHLATMKFGKYLEDKVRRGKLKAGGKAEGTECSFPDADLSHAPSLPTHTLHTGPPRVARQLPPVHRPQKPDQGSRRRSVRAGPKRVVFAAHDVAHRRAGFSLQNRGRTLLRAAGS